MEIMSTLASRAIDMRFEAFPSLSVVPCPAILWKDKVLKASTITLLDRAVARPVRLYLLRIAQRAGRTDSSARSEKMGGE